MSIVMTASVVEFNIRWLKMMSVPESQTAVGRPDGLNGRDRADKVKAALVQGGVSPSIIKALGVGQNELSVRTKSGKRLLENRRVVLTILPKNG